MDEKQAIRKLKNGDISGLEFLVREHQARAVRTAYMITRDAGLAEDVVQEVFIKVYDLIAGFDSSRSFAPWFLRSVVNASVKIMQKSARQVEVGDEAEAESLFKELSLHVKSIESQVEESELHERVWDAMQKLSPRQRAVIVQRYFLDMSEKEMAGAAGVAPGSVKWMLNSARERLRALLAAKE